MNAIVLAAGRGTRMKSRVSKVLHPVLGRTMLDHVRRAVHQAFNGHCIVVVDPATGRDSDLSSTCHLAVQSVPLGTADAVAVGAEALPAIEGAVVVLNGDVPLIRPESLQRIAETHQDSGAKLTLSTFEADPGTRYGRIRRRAGRIVGVVEAAEEEIDRSEGYEANGGVYCFDIGWLREQIGNVRVSASGEYYLTSLIGIAARETTDEPRVASVLIDVDELLGVDDRLRLANAERILRERVLEFHMSTGVTIVDPSRTIIEYDVEIDPDVRVEPGSILRSGTRVGGGSIIGPYSIVERSEVGRDCVVVQSWVEDARLADRVRVGPFARLRPGTVVADDVFIGNFVETKQSEIGANSDIHHVSYIGDATLGTNVNIGAGTITCNFDGHSKHRTIIGDDVFVGCDTMLVAPVELAARSRTGAGAVVTRSVPRGQTVIGVPARPLSHTSRAKPQEDHGR